MDSTNKEAAVFTQGLADSGDENEDRSVPWKRQLLYVGPAGRVLLDLNQLHWGPCQARDFLPSIVRSASIGTATPSIG